MLGFQINTLSLNDCAIASSIVKGNKLSEYFTSNNTYQTAKYAFIDFYCS